MAPPVKCPTCGEKILPSVGECLYCVAEGSSAVVETAAAPAVPDAPTAPPEAAAELAAEPLPSPPVPEPAPETETASPAPAPSSVEAPAPSRATAPMDDRVYGLVLFDAEEALARGLADKALVHASRAVRERPADLIARGLYERARRETLRGRRREKLDSKVREAMDLFEAGDFAAAGKIVGSALKLVPDHAEALALFSRLRDRRLQAPTTEADAERELDRLARTQAHRDALAARSALKSGWDFRAALMVRRALRHVPDDPELLELLAQAQASLEVTQAERRRKATLEGQVRRAFGLLEAGELEPSRNLLRAVLKEDPANPRAQAAVQMVRVAWLERQGVPLVPVLGAPAAAVPPPAAPAPLPQGTKAAPEREMLPRPLPARAPVLSAAPTPAAAIPPEILLPRTRRAHTPWGWIAAGAVIVFGGLVLLARGGSDGRPVPSPAALARPATTLAAPESLVPEATAAPEAGPLDAVEPELRTSIEATLEAYARALETMNAGRLAAARPDLTPALRAAMLKPFEGALNVATDLRVLDVVRRGEVVDVPLLRHDVIVGGREGGGGGTVEETLRFTRSGGSWVLKPRP